MIMDWPYSLRENSVTAKPEETHMMKLRIDSCKLSSDLYTSAIWHTYDTDGGQTIDNFGELVLFFYYEFWRLNFGPEICIATTYVH